MFLMDDELTDSVESRATRSVKFRSRYSEPSTPARQPGPCLDCAFKGWPVWSSIFKRALSERIPTGPSKSRTSGPTEPSQTSELSAKTFISAPFISARSRCSSPVRRAGTGALRRGLTFRYPRLPHCALVCWPGLLLTETTSSDSGSMRHIA